LLRQIKQKQKKSNKPGKGKKERYYEYKNARPPTEVITIPNHHQRSGLMRSSRVIKLLMLNDELPCPVAWRFFFDFWGLSTGFKVSVGNICGGL
jgi:hypothetical protein